MWASGTVKLVEDQVEPQGEPLKHLRTGTKDTLGRRERLKPYKGQLARVRWVVKGSKVAT